MPKSDNTTPYTRHEVIGRGSYGIVYKGVHNQSKALVAIKVLNLDTAEDEVSDIQKEIVLLQSLKASDAQNVCRYHGSFLNGTRLWIIMDYCEGGSIRTLMKSGRIEEKYIVVIVREVLTALSYIHKADIIHRDIKAANVLVTNDGRVQLCDFGVAAQLAANHFKRNTFVGTPYWMAPEVISDGLSYNFKADIWSLGITIYEIAMGNPPYADQEPMRAVFLIPRSSPPRLDGAHFSLLLKDFVSHCLCTNPTERPTAAELLRQKLMKNTKQPTSILRELIARFEAWKKSGGVRQSLAMVNGNDDEQELDNEFGLDDAGNAGWDFDTVRRSLLEPTRMTWEQSADATEDLLKTIKPIGPPSSSDVSSNTVTQRSQHPLLQLFGEDNVPSLSRQASMSRAMPKLPESQTSEPISIEIPSLDAISISTTSNQSPTLPVIPTSPLTLNQRPASIYRARERPVLGINTRQNSMDAYSSRKGAPTSAEQEKSPDKPTNPTSPVMLEDSKRKSESESSSQATPTATSPLKTFTMPVTTRARSRSPTRIPIPSPISPPSSPSRSIRSNTHSASTSASSMASIVPKLSFNPSNALQHLHQNPSTQSLPEHAQRPSIGGVIRERSPSASALPQISKHMKKPSSLMLNLNSPNLKDDTILPPSPSRAHMFKTIQPTATASSPLVPQVVPEGPITFTELPALQALDMQVMTQNDPDLLLGELSRVFQDILGQLQHVEDGLSSLPGVSSIP